MCLEILLKIFSPWVYVISDYLTDELSFINAFISASVKVDQYLPSTCFFFSVFILSSYLKVSIITRLNIFTSGMKISCDLYMQLIRQTRHTQFNVELESKNQIYKPNVFFKT